MGNLTKEEMETIILYNQAEGMATCDTCDKKLITKLDKLCEKDKRITIEKETENGKVYKFPKSWVKVKLPRELSEEKREELAERARKNLGRKN